jgi:hypothetical protein
VSTIHDSIDGGEGQPEKERYTSQHRGVSVTKTPVYEDPQDYLRDTTPPPKSTYYSYHHQNLLTTHAIESDAAV